MYGACLTQLWALGPTKLSVLFLYRRIFGVTGRKFNTVSMTLIFIVICWFIAFLFTNMFQYYPIQGMWATNPKDAHAIKNPTTMFLAQSYADVALDVIIIAVPIPLSKSQFLLSIQCTLLIHAVWKLQMDFKKKMWISCIFLMGALTVAASVARTAVQYGVAEECKSNWSIFAARTHSNPSVVNKHNPDTPYYTSPVNYWPIIESSLGIVGACLPLLRPIGHVYSLRNIYLVSIRALTRISRINGSSKGSSRGSNQSHSSKETSIRNDPQCHNETAEGEKWLRLYHNR
jgi:hypothetical protein